jgi:transcriptional regulator with XRE-family HTH domain
MAPPKEVERFIGQMRAIREELGITQSELARLVGKTPGYVCDTERGRRTPNLTTVCKFAKAMGAEVVIQKSR